MTPLEHTYLAVLLFCVAFFGYTYVGYPAILWVFGFFKGRSADPHASGREWPSVSIAVAAHNEEDQIDGLLQSLLALDYPEDKLQVLVTSDGSTDRTAERVRAFADRGVELLRIPERGGKTKAETRAAPHLRGDIVLNTDASIRLDASALKHLVIAFDDPGIGVASGRDVSIGGTRDGGNRGEAGYVGYEMTVRELETRVSGIVGASGCLYAIRSELHGEDLPAALSRDFASALIAREQGFRAVYVRDAVCFVPRASSLRREYRRKVRTIARGMDTLAFKRHLLNPARFPLFSWMLFSHKICRWLVPWAVGLILLMLGALAVSQPLARILFLAGVVVLALAGLGWAGSERPNLPRILAIPAYLAVGNVAALQGFIQFARGEREAVWEPTKRDTFEAD